MFFRSLIFFILRTVLFFPLKKSKLIKKSVLNIGNEAPLRNLHHHKGYQINYCRYSCHLFLQTKLVQKFQNQHTTVHNWRNQTKGDSYLREFGQLKWAALIRSPSKDLKLVDLIKYSACESFWGERVSIVEGKALLWFLQNYYRA